MAGPSLQVTRLPQRFVSDDRRVITRFFDPGGETRIRSVVVRVLGLSDDEARCALDQTLARYAPRHRRIEAVFLDHFQRLAAQHAIPADISRLRRMLIGAYFTMEYSIESAALFNPSIVPAPDQGAVGPGELRFILSLRATGEGHVSSIVFRTGVLDAVGGIHFDTPSPYVHHLRRVPTQVFETAWLRRTLTAMGLYTESLQVILDQLGESFTLVEAESLCRDAERSGVFGDDARHVLWVCHSNYDLALPPETDPSEIVIFPTSESERNGIEDARFVRFVDDDGSVRTYGTFTAVSGGSFQCQLMEIQGFRNLRVRSLHGTFARNKGMALFPRRVGGRYTMLARTDGENNYLLSSTDITRWDEAALLQTPQRPWEFVQVGNCGSPIETDRGWLILTHGVGPMREYCIGASLLDLEDPTRVLGHLPDPLIVPAEDEREGYVPNVVYSCGALVHGERLIIPYATADRATNFASVRLAALLARLLD